MQVIVYFSLFQMTLKAFIYPFLFVPVIERCYVSSHDIRNQSTLRSEGISDVIDNETPFIDFLTSNIRIEMNTLIQTVFEEGGTSVNEISQYVIQRFLYVKGSKTKDTSKEALCLHASDNNFQFKTLRPCSQKYYAHCVDDSCTRLRFGLN